MTAWKRTRKILSWVVINGAYWILLVLGTVGKLGWAFNIWVFTTWFFTLLYGFVGTILGLASVTETEVDHSKVEFGIPTTISAVSDFAMALFAAALGHWFYALLVVVQQFSEQLVRGLVKEKPAATPVAS